MRQRCWFRSVLLIAACLSPLVLLLVGCATAGTYANARQSNDATLRGKPAHLVKALTSGDSNTFVSEIDGVPTRGGSGATFYVRPGKHKIGMRIIAQGMYTSKGTVGYVDVEVAPNRVYRFRAKRSGISFDMELVDETDGTTPTVKQTWKLEEKSSTVPIFIPVPIL